MALTFKYTRGELLLVFGTTIKSSKCKKLLGGHFDNKLKFDTDIEDICKMANRKLNAFAKKTPFMDLNEEKFVF